MPLASDVPVLTDGVVTLRSHDPDDVPRIVEQCTDPESARWLTLPTPYGAPEAEAFVRDAARGWADGTAWSFAMEHDGRFVGTIALRRHGLGEAEVGFGLHPDARGLGLLRRGLALLLDRVFAEGQVTVVHWRCDVGNWPSRRTAWAVGFRFGPTLPAPAGRTDRWSAWIGRDDPREPRTAWLEPVPLEGDGVRLRSWRADDGPRLVEVAHDPEVRARLPRTPLPRTPADVEGYLTQAAVRAAEGERVAWCVADPVTDAALADVTVLGIAHGRAEVGFWSHPDARGRGLVPRAVDLVATHAFAHLDVRRLDLLTGASNRAARAVAERAGFVLVGIEHQRVPGPGAATGEDWEDAARYELVGRTSGLRGTLSSSRRS